MGWWGKKEDGNMESLHMILFVLFHSINPWIRTLQKFQTSPVTQRDKLNSCLEETTKYQDQ